MSQEMYTLENEVLKIGVNTHGAELVSVVDKSCGREYMWSGDPAYWNRVSPVLFPFIGKLKNLSYTHNGVEYGNVPQHGYARDCDFTFAFRTNDTICFELCSDEVWKERYPFDFQLRIGYRLVGKAVYVLWDVKNDSEEDMPFSIGAHPAFIMPEGASKNGFWADLHNGADTLICGTLSEKGVLLPTQRSFPLEAGRLKLTDELFDADALIIDSNDIHTVSLHTPDGTPFIQVHFDTPQLGLWSPAGKKAPFVCIEPWYGRCDRENYDGDLTHREYGNIVKPGELFHGEYVIEIL